MKRRFGGLAGAYLLLAFACGLADAWSSASSDSTCDGSTIVLELEEAPSSSPASPSSPMPSDASSASKGHPTFYSLPSPFGPWASLPRNSSAAGPMRLLVAEPVDACKEVAAGGGTPSSTPFALLVARGGGCSFLGKVRRAREAGASGVVVFSAGRRGCVALGFAGPSSGGANSSSSAGGDSPSRGELEALPLTVSVDAATGTRLLAAAGSASSSASASATTTALVRIFEPGPSGLVDGSALVLGALAVSGLLIGAFLASRDEVERRTRRRAHEANDAPAAATEGGEEREEDAEQDEGLAFSSLSDVAFVVALMASALLAAFFFPRIFSFLLAALFVFGATEATGCAAASLVAKAFPATETREISFPLPGFWSKGASDTEGGEKEQEALSGGENESAAAAAAAKAATKTKITVSVSTLAGFAGIALPAALAWLLYGPRRIWPVHDLLALSLISSIPTALRLPSFRACAALLLLAACNDVFFVFLQPLLTNSQSVMVSVATATPALVLLSPLQQGGPRAGFALLGFGDVVIPGACVAFAARWDSLRLLKKKQGRESTSPPSLFSSLASSFSSLLASVLGYCLGLCLTYLALYHRFGSSAGQPALLYLSPCVLLATAVAICVRGGRGELRAAWLGLDSKEDRERRGHSESAPLVV